MKKTSAGRSGNALPFVKILRLVCGLGVLCLPLVLVACRGAEPGPVMEAPELGLSMQAPPGWNIASGNPRVASHGNATGIILDEPLKGKEFQARVEELSREFGGKVVSSSPTSVGEYEAVEAIIEYPGPGSKALKLYIHKGDTLIQVSFVVPMGDFANEEAALRESLESIELTS